MKTIRCPICERQFDPASSDAMPFCSKRCKQIDLGAWASDSYKIPVQPGPGELEDEVPDQQL